MIAPLSWLTEYIDIKMEPKKLGDKLTEVGLGCEKILHEKDDTIFELEITPNRPDWLSVVGVAREIAAIEGKKIKFPPLKTSLKPKKTTKLLSLTIHPNYSCSQRMTGIIISGITVKDSPKWLKDRLQSIGQRPINNIVDITNYVMGELGNPIHAFDYEKIAAHEMWVSLAKGGESFESVDGISYHLPKGAIIYTDKEKIFDLAEIKGGKNSGTYESTKTLFSLVPVDNPVLIRRASLALGLRSDASAIFERAVNKGGTIDALKRTIDLILENAGGEIASQLIDMKEQDFKPWKLSLRLERLEFILGIKIPEKEVITILERLNLIPVLKSSLRGTAATKQSHSTIECLIPTYRNDLHIEEDLVEEVARMYGYNNFPKTMMDGQIPTMQIPYFHDFVTDEKVKRFLQADDFSEVYTYSLLSEKDLAQEGIQSEKVLRIDNPVSRDFEYLRPTLRVNLMKALIQNQANTKDVNLFELGKVYLGKNLDEASETNYLSGISNNKSYYEIKGLLERLFTDLGVKKDPSEYMLVLDEGIFFEIPYTELLEKAQLSKIFHPIPKYPALTEDITLVVNRDAKIGKIIDNIKEIDSLVVHVSLVDMYENTRTFHIVYQDKSKNLTTEDIAPVREKIIKELEKKFSAKIK